MKDAILQYLRSHHGGVLDFWRRASPTAAAPIEPTIEQHCDVVYTLVLADAADAIDRRAPGLFADRLAQRALPGWGANGTREAPLSIHNCAYAFGALNLLRERHGDLYPRALAGRTFRATELIDEVTGRPKFPWWLAHHHWRVSHWLGGVPSLLWSAGHSALPEAPRIRTLAASVLQATDAWLTEGRGFIKLYRLRAVHQLFRLLYSLRHDPDLGDVGGVAHILWINHVAGRPYVAADRLLDRASHLFGRYRPFMEARPYCLDFDVVQIVRTALDQTGQPPGANRDRAHEMMRDLEVFVRSGLTAGYGLHKLPGALATYHECALLCGAETTPQLGRPHDIIGRAYWL